MSLRNGAENKKRWTLLHSTPLPLFDAAAFRFPRLRVHASGHPSPAQGGTSQSRLNGLPNKRKAASSKGAASQTTRRRRSVDECLVAVQARSAAARRAHAARARRALFRQENCFAFFFLQSFSKTFAHHSLCSSRAESTSYTVHNSATNVSTATAAHIIVVVCLPRLLDCRTRPSYHIHGHLAH